MTGLGDALLATVEGAAFLACGAAVGRLDEVTTDPGLTLCLAAHALAEVRRGTDGGRLRGFVEEPGEWLLHAAGELDVADTAWWSEPPHHRVLRQVAPDAAGIERHDARDRLRSTVEEADAHLHTFTSRDRRMPPHRFRLAAGAAVLTLDGPDDVDDEVRAAIAAAPGGNAPGVHLTLRGALTIPRRLLDPWPWAVAGVHWSSGVPTDVTAEAAIGPEPRVVHDYGWPPIGRPYDPRFDEGDEVDGSELDMTGLDGTG